MAAEVQAQNYKDLVVFLATAGVVVPLFQRLRISPVLGFLAAGVALGPHGLARLAETVPLLGLVTISDPEEIRVLAEFGVVFLLFMIGLELSWERLKRMRRLVFGLGVLQILLCGALIGAGAWLLGLPAGAAVIVGAALALSSTALVMPVLAERKRLNTGVGRTTFSVLLAQDLAVAPILIMVAVMAAQADGASWVQAPLSLLTAVAAMGLLLLAGRLVLRPLLRSVARSESRELFMAACLLVVIGAGLAAALSGLSMALGAFLAGLLLAETEFRREVELTIEPFKGLLLGLFFVSVGIGLDLGALMAAPGLVFGAALAVMAVKGLAVLALARLFGLPARTAVEAALMLGPAGEFAFVVLSQALAGGLVDAAVVQALLLSATVSLFLVPLIAPVAERLGARAAAASARAEPELEAPEPADARVLVVGFGRVGRLVGEMLERHEVPYVAVDSDPRLVQAERSAGRRIFYGDATRGEFLHLCGVEGMSALVVTMDAPGKVEAVVQAALALRPDLTLVARARDARHAAKLYAMGVTDAVPETVEASLQLAENTLVDIGVPMGLVIASIHEKRDEFRALFQQNTADDRPTRGVKPSSAGR